MKLNVVSQNQGLGFVIFNIVIDKGYFFRFFVKLGGVTATAMTTLVTLQQGRTSTGTCGLSEEDANAFATTAALVNASCTYKLTVSPSGVVFHT